MNVKDRRVSFYIIVKVCDRPRLVCNFIESLANFLDRRQQTDSFRLLLFDDSISSDVEEAVKKKIRGMGRLPYEFEFWNWKRQRDFLCSNFSQKQLNDYVDFVGNIFSETSEWHHRGGVRFDNIIMLILSCLKGDDPRPRLYCHFDDDESFSALVAEDDHFCMKEMPFDYFQEMKNIFLNSNASLVTSTYTGDPPMSSAGMLRTNLEDCLDFFEYLEYSGNNPNAPYRVPEINREAYSFETMAFYDHSELMGRHRKTYDRRYKYHYRFKERISKPTLAVALQNYLRELLYSPFGVHPTRPILWQEGFYCRPANNVFPGNYVSNDNMLRFVFPVASPRIRRKGPLYGRLLNQVIGKRLRITNLPVMHHKVLNYEIGPEFRIGVNTSKEFTDFSGEMLSQFRGDVIIETVEQIQEKIGNLLGLVFFGKQGQEIFNREYRQSIERVGEIYYKNAREIQQVISKFEERGYLYDNRFWWNMEPYKPQLSAVTHLIQSAKRAWDTGRVIPSFIAQVCQPEEVENIKRQIIATLKTYHNLIPKLNVSYGRSLMSIAVHYARLLASFGSQDRFHNQKPSP